MLSWRKILYDNKQLTFFEIVSKSRKELNNNINTCIAVENTEGLRKKEILKLLRKKLPGSLFLIFNRRDLYQYEMRAFSLQ